MIGPALTPGRPSRLSYRQRLQFHLILALNLAVQIRQQHDPGPPPDCVATRCQHLVAGPSHDLFGSVNMMSEQVRHLRIVELAS